MQVMNIQISLKFKSFSSLPRSKTYEKHKNEKWVKVKNTSFISEFEFIINNVSHSNEIVVRYLYLEFLKRFM